MTFLFTYHLSPRENGNEWDSLGTGPCPLKAQYLARAAPGNHGECATSADGELDGLMDAPSSAKHLVKGEDAVTAHCSLYLHLYGVCFLAIDHTQACARHSERHSQHIQSWS